MEKGDIDVFIENPPRDLGKGKDPGLIYPDKKNISLINKFRIKKDVNLESNYIMKDFNLLNPIIKSVNKLPLDQIKIQFNPAFTNLRVRSKSIIVDARTSITADNIAEFAYPLAQFVEQVRPDYIIACDRGARIIGLAVHMMYRELYGVSLPTQDHAIHFRKISRRVPAGAVQDTLRPDIERMLTATESPTVLVLDDWVATGGTKALVQDVFRKLSGGRINLLYGVMRGTGADVSGSQDSGALGDWHDRADLIGVDYYGSTLEPHKVESPAAIAYRKKMSESIHSFAQQFTLQPV